MTLRTLFAKEVYIRLTEHDGTFVCTIQRGPFQSKPVEVSVEEAPACLDGRDSEPCNSHVLNLEMRTRTDRFFS
jgi:hypothetical protein